MLQKLKLHLIEVRQKGKLNLLLTQQILTFNLKTRIFMPKVKDYLGFFRFIIWQPGVLLHLLLTVRQLLHLIDHNQTYKSCCQTKRTDQPQVLYFEAKLKSLYVYIIKY